MILSYLEITQPIGAFYMVSVPADTLFKMVTVRRHDIEAFEGVQRELSKDRVAKISKFCKEADAVFPTSIVVSVDKGIPYSIDKEAHTLYIPDNAIIGDVIDGQHRLWGIKESRLESNFDLPVVLMFDLEIAEKAYVFSIINSTQTKVNKSLIYNLFGLSTERSPYKTCHEIARALNSKMSSPFFGRLKMLGKKEPNQPNATLSQGTFVKQLLSLIAKNPDEDTRQIKDGKKLTPYTDLPLRQFFIADKDDIILKILENCFSALKRTFPDEWLYPDNYILWKTTGFCGVMKALNSILRTGLSENDLTEDFFYKMFSGFRAYLNSNQISLTSQFFPGGGEQNQKRLARMIVESISGAGILGHEGVSTATDFANFLNRICEDMSIHEKYELAGIINGKKNDLLFFIVSELDADTIKIYYPFYDASFVMNCKNRSDYMKIIEDKWFDGLDADTWYGYKQAMDKDE